VTTPRSDQELVLRLVDEVVNGRRLDLADELVHPDFFDHHASASRSCGPDGLRATVAALHDAFAGFRLEPRDVIADGDKVVVRATVSGRHVAEFEGAPAAGAEWSTQRIHIFRVAGGQVIERWASDDAPTPIPRVRPKLQSEAAKRRTRNDMRRMS
jgi:predicted ester cyclase